jgi:hypothetical protein
MPRYEMGELGMSVLDELLSLGRLASEGSESDQGRWGWRL